jgi:hypothetical protein
MLEARNERHPETGVTLNLRATDAGGSAWYFDVIGSFTSDRAGLRRTDSVWKTLGRASALAAAGLQPLVLLTTNLPPRESVGGKALRFMSGHSYLDAVEMLSAEGKARLKAYATGRTQHALPGFLTARDVYGDSVQTVPSLGAAIRVPLVDTGEPFRQLHDDYAIAGMRHQLRIFLPSRTRSDEAIDAALRSAVVAKIKGMLSALGGGCTTQEGTGSWVDPIGGVIDEQVHVLETYSGDQVDSATLRSIVDLVLNDLDQHTVAITIDDGMYHVSRPSPDRQGVAGC